MSYFFIPGIEREMYEERLRDAERRRQINQFRANQPSALGSFRSWLGDSLIAGGSFLKGQGRNHQNGTFLPREVRYSGQRR